MQIAYPAMYQHVFETVYRIVLPCSELPNLLVQLVGTLLQERQLTLNVTKLAAHSILF